MDSITLKEGTCWGKSLKGLESFTIEVFTSKVDKNGSQRLLQRGNRFYLEEYVKNIFTGVLENGEIVVKAVCYPSQRKNDPPRPLYLRYQNNALTGFFCSCQAGYVLNKTYVTCKQYIYF
jgi:hypothetical protein